MNAQFERELEKRIEKHLEAWADWSRMSEDEQNETFNEIYQIVQWAMNKEREAHQVLVKK